MQTVRSWETCFSLSFSLFVSLFEKALLWAGKAALILGVDTELKAKPGKKWDQAWNDMSASNLRSTWLKSSSSFEKLTNKSRNRTLNLIFILISRHVFCLNLGQADISVKLLHQNIASYFHISSDSLTWINSRVGKNSSGDRACFVLFFF